MVFVFHLRIVIESNLCPVADAGETKGILNINLSSVGRRRLFDPDGTELEYNWIV